MCFFGKTVFFVDICNTAPKISWKRKKTLTSTITTGLFNTAYAGGMLIGPLWGGFVNLKAGWGALGWSLGILCVVGTIVGALWTGGWVGEAWKRRGDEENGGRREGGGEGEGERV